MREPYIGNPQTRVPRTGRQDMVPTGPVREHIRALIEIGMTPSMVERAAGLSTSSIPRILTRQATVRRVIADAILRVDGRPMRHQAIVLNVGCRRRLEALAVIGYTGDAIGAALGVDRRQVHAFRVQARLSWLHHELVADMYDRMGPDGGSDRVRLWAAKQGWVHPMLWDDIDDPFEVPVAVADSGVVDEVVVERLVAGVATRAASAERKAAFGVLLGRGVTVSAAAVAVGLNHRTALKYSSEVAA